MNVYLLVLGYLFLMGCGPINLNASPQVDIPSSKAPKKLPTVVVFKEINGAKLNLFIYKPNHAHQQNSKKTAIVFFHSGGWRKGEANQFYRHSNYLAEHGIVAFNAEYRQKDEHNTTPIEAVADAKSAIRWVRKNALSFNIATDRIIAAGGSAGGQLAVATAIVEGHDDPKDNLTISATPNALVLFNPVLDMSRWEKQFHVELDSVSPLQLVNKPLPPTLIFHGTNDKVAPFATAEQFVKKATRLGSPTIKLESYPGREHGFFNFEDDFKSSLLSTYSFICNLGWFSC